MFCRAFAEFREMQYTRPQFSLMIAIFLSLLVLTLWGPLSTLSAQTDYRSSLSGAPAPKPPPLPSRSINRAEQTPQPAETDPSFPQLELEEAPLQVPGTVRGGGFVRTELLYRKLIFEAFFGYYGAVLNLYSMDDSNGNSNGNTRESDWNNLYNIMVGGQFSGNVRRFHYSAWFSVPFNLGADYTQLRNYEFAEFPQFEPKFDYLKDELSYRSTLKSKVSYFFTGGLQLGASIVDRKSAKLIIGGGMEGMLGQWETEGGQGRIYGLRLGVVELNVNGSKANDNSKMFSGHLLPFFYVQAGAFLSPFVEVLAGVGYSPLTLWFSEENRTTGEDNPNKQPRQYRRYGYFGQTILGEVQVRMWLNRRFTLKLGVKGRYTFKTAGNLRVYDNIGDDGKVADEETFLLQVGNAALQYFQISAFLGIGLAFDGKLPPGRKYAMPF